MLITELAVVVALGLTFLVVAIAQGRFSWDPLLPTAARNGGSGITLALPLALLAMTCDAATPAAEETRNARRTIPQAVVITCVLIGAWYVVGFSAFALAAPREELFSLVADPNINPIAPLARRVWGRFDLLVTITGMTASIGALIPCSTAASRVLFAMGRDGNLPGWLGTVDPRSRAPRNALHVVYLAALLGVIPAALVIGATPTINWWSNIFGWYIAVVYFFANLSNLVYYRRFLRHQFHFSWNLLVPLVGIGAQLLVIWQLVVKEMWKDWFGRSGQIFIVATMLMTVAYVCLSRGRRAPGDSPRPGGT
jgi:amino acid transporter